MSNLIISNFLLVISNWILQSYSILNCDTRVKNILIVYIGKVLTIVDFVSSSLKAFVNVTQALTEIGYDTQAFTCHYFINQTLTSFFMLTFITDIFVIAHGLICGN